VAGEPPQRAAAYLLFDHSNLFWRRVYAAANNPLR
jgi:hypothetical protein